VLSLNPLLDVDRIAGLQQAAPEPQEVQTIKDWLAQGGTNTYNTLNEVDQFFVTVSDKVPHFLNRLKCWKFIIKFDEDNNSVAAELLKVQRGLKAVRYSKGFAKVLEITLAIGNFMNFGTRTGATVAFDIADLIKLAESPANDRSAGNLIDFLITTLESSYPDAVGWTKEMVDVKQTKEASWEKIDLGMKEIQSQLTAVKSLIKDITPIGAHDNFAKITAAISRAEKDFEPTKSLCEGVERDWQNVAKLFAKDPDKTKPEAFCGLIWDFITKFNNTIDERAKREEALQKQRAKDKAREDIERKKDALNKRKTELENKITRENSLSGSDLGDTTPEQSSAPTTPRQSTLSQSTAASLPSSPVSKPTTATTTTTATTSATPAATLSATTKDDDVDEVFQAIEKGASLLSKTMPSDVPTRRGSTTKTVSAAEKRKLLEEKRKKLAAARAKNKT